MKDLQRLWNKIKKMRLLWLNVSCVLVCILSYAGVKAGGFDNIEIEGGFTRDNYRKEITHLFQTEINQSLKYLYTGIGYGHQMVERPGMAKYLQELSDTRWEEALGTIKKYIERGGSTTDLFHHGHFSFSGKNELIMSPEPKRDNRQDYLKTLKNLYRDSERLMEALNRIHQMTQTAREGHHDGDWSHFAEERLEKESLRSRKMMGDITTLNQMSNSTIAFHIFDSHLA